MRSTNIRSLWIASAILMLATVASNAQNVATNPRAYRPGQATGASAANPQAPHNHTVGVANTAIANATFTCTYSFTAGAGQTYMNYCLTVNGTFANFQSPAGNEMLDQDGSYEGYGICDESTNTQYYDYNYGDSGNWNAPTTVLNTATEVKIERTTSDGLWTLTTTVLREAGPPPYAKVTMALKNNSGITKFPIFMRYANFLPDLAASTGYYAENYDGSANSAWGNNPYSGLYAGYGEAYGMMLQNASNPIPSSTGTSWAGFAQSTEGGPNPCDPLANFVDTGILNGEGSGVLEYFPTLTKEQTVTVSMKYFAF